MRIRPRKRIPSNIGCESVAKNWENKNRISFMNAIRTAIEYFASPIYKALERRP